MCRILMYTWVVLCQDSGRLYRCTVLAGHTRESKMNLSANVDSTWNY